MITLTDKTALHDTESSGRVVRDTAHNGMQIKLAFVYQFKCGNQNILHQGQTGGCGQVALSSLFLDGMWCMVGRNDIQAAIADCRDQCSLVRSALDRRVTFDQVAVLLVLRVIKMQKMNTGFRGDAFAVMGPGSNRSSSRAVDICSTCNCAWYLFASATASSLDA